MSAARAPLRRLVDPDRPITYGIVQAGPNMPGGVPYIRPVDMASETGVTGQLLRATREIADKYRRSSVRPGDLVVSIGPSYGKVMVVPSELAGANLTQGTARVSIRLPNDPRFVFWALRSAETEAFWAAEAQGATLRSVNLEELGKTPIPIIPVDRQRSIASFLDRETARIDVLIAQKERLLALLDEKRQAVVDYAVTKGLDPDAPLRESGHEWIGRLPTAWGVVKVKHVAKVESGHTPSKSVPEYWENCDIPWVSLRDSAQLRVNDYITETHSRINALGLANSSARMLPPNAVVFSRDATVGLTAITTCPMAVSQHFIAWLCGPRLLPKYLLYVVHAMRPELERLTMGSTIVTVGMPEILALVTPLPPIEEQRRIVAHVDQQRKGLALVIKGTTDSIALLRERRQALITVAVTGQLDTHGHVLQEAIA